MESKEIIKEARNAIESGESKAKIKTLLKGSGYTQEEVKNIMKRVEGKNEEKTGEKKGLSKSTKWQLIGVIVTIAILITTLISTRIIPLGSSPSPEEKVKSLMNKQCKYIEESDLEPLAETYYPQLPLKESHLYREGAIDNCEYDLKSFELYEDGEKAAVEAELILEGPLIQEEIERKIEFVKIQGNWYQHYKTETPETPKEEKYSTEENYEVVKFPVNGNAWGYYGWEDCSSQTGSWEDVDQFCKCMGYPGAASKSQGPCYHGEEYSRSKWVPEDNNKNCIRSWGEKGPGYALTKVKCRVLN